MVDRLKGKVPRLEIIAADHGYKVSFIEHVEKEHGWRVEIAQNRTADGSILGDAYFAVWRKPQNVRRAAVAEAVSRIGFISIPINRLTK